jgi:hypothetical protein
MMVYSFVLTMLIACKDNPETEEEETAVVETEELLSFEVTGTIVDSEGTPVAQAMVMVGGDSENFVLADDEGNFSLWFSDDGYREPTIVATKKGFRSVGYEFFKPDTPITLKIREITEPDNLEYTYEDPGDGYDHMKEDCSHCHTSFVLDFLESKHSESASNPLVQDLYAGITRAYSTEETCIQAEGQWLQGLEPGTEGNMVWKCYLGGGVLPDFNQNCGGEDQLSCDNVNLDNDDKPTHFGACADCHAPGINGVAGGRNLHEAVGIEYSAGVQCDSCHKVKDIDLSKPPGVGQRMVMGRPNEPGRNTFVWDPVYYGPLMDVPNVAMGGSYQEKFNESVFCAGCHELEQMSVLPDQTIDTEKWPNGISIQSTYSEWDDGPYNQEETQCQFCHMPANTELTNSVDIATRDNQSITFGFLREPEDIRRHIFRGPLQGDPRLIDKAVYVSVMSEVIGTELKASVSVANIGCGHAIPTGEPMRALLLLVEAEGDCGTLTTTGGKTIPDTGGVLLTGVVGDDIDFVGNSASWLDANTIVEVGQVLRVVRPSGTFDDYQGVGYFGEVDRTPEEKGMEQYAPIGSALVVSIDESQVQLDATLDVLPGDIVFLGEVWPDEPNDGQNSMALAGEAGYSFSKILIDAEGNRHVPHYRAIDIASDNRISPGTNVVTEHVFSIPSECNTGTVTATVLYRPIPLAFAQERAWEAVDYIISQGTETW